MSISTVVSVVKSGKFNANKKIEALAQSFVILSGGNSVTFITGMSYFRIQKVLASLKVKITF